MKIIGVIPARFGSSRFPGKPLIDIGGKSMIHRVYDQAKKSKFLTEVIVATDDKRIENHVKEFGGNVIMTSSALQSGTDRCFEAVKKYGDKFDIVINIQGDEPFIMPEQIDLVAASFNSENVNIATLVKKIVLYEELINVNTPKVILNKDGEAIYFSRQIIPYIRDIDQLNWMDRHIFYKHIGIYGFKTKVLAEITQLEQSSLELTEGLEQLRWIQNGYKIKTKTTDFESIAIDVPEDLKKLTNFL